MKRFFVFWMICYLMLASPGFPGGDYKFLDAAGNEVLLPTDLPIYTQKKPGPWKGHEKEHRVAIRTKLRTAGLEMNYELTLFIPHPMTEKDRVEAIYLVDKDGLIVGYKAFTTSASEASAKILINGVINYIQVYILCTHSLWKSEFHI